MEDQQIVELFWRRDEKAIAETAKKYGSYCFSIAVRILHNAEDAEESVNDTYNGAWNTMPPHRPAILSTFLGKIARRTALKHYRQNNTEKRGGGELTITLEELGECISSGRQLDEELEVKELAAVIDRFLSKLPITERRVFLRRYWYLDSVTEIATRFGFSQSKVKMILKRTRDKLMQQLKKEDVWL